MPFRPLSMESFGHKMFILSQQKTYLTKVVKEYELIKETFEKSWGEWTQPYQWS